MSFFRYTKPMFQTDEYLQLLNGLGLKPQEAKIYFACLTIGQATAGTISRKAGIQRTFAYDILEDLAEKGLASYVTYRGKRYYSVVSSKRFLSLQEEKFARYSQLLPELQAMERTGGDRPAVQYFEGREGVIAALEDALQQPKSSEILTYSTGEGFYTDDPHYAQNYVKRRVREDISVRAIAPDNPETRAWSDNDLKSKRTTRLIPAGRFPFSNEIDIYGNKLVIISLVGELLAVIIESESVAKTQRAIFELAWEGAEKYGL